MNIDRAMRGEDPGTFPVYLRRKRELLINMQTARTLGFSPTWETLTMAELLHEQESRQQLTLAQVMERAYDHNPQVLAEQANQIKANATNRRAYSELWPPAHRHV